MVPGIVGSVSSIDGSGSNTIGGGALYRTKCTYVIQYITSTSDLMSALLHHTAGSRGKTLNLFFVQETYFVHKNGCGLQQYLHIKIK